MDTAILASILGGGENHAFKKEKPCFEIVGYNEINKYNEQSDDVDISVFIADNKAYDKVKFLFFD